MKNKFYILLPLILGTSMAGLDSSIVNVSLPVMRKQFNCQLDDIEWVITSYMISFCLFMPLINWLKKRIGYYYLYIASISIFTIGSLLCSVSGSLSFLIVARIIQAIGGGSITPTSMSIISDTFPKEERGQALGWWGLGTNLFPAIGPTLGGVLTEYFGWPSIFYINIPIGIVTIFFFTKYFSFLKNEDRARTHFDIRGFIYFSLFILLIQYSISIASKVGFASPVLWIGFLIAGIALFLFIRSGKKDDPLLDLSVFKHRIFVKGILITIVRAIALYGGIFLLPFLLQGLMGFSQVQSGLLMLPNSIAIAILTPIAGAYADKHGARRISVAGLLLLSLSMFMFSRINVGYAFWMIIITMLIRGAGLGLLVSPISSTILNAVDSAQYATASSFYSLMQQLGGSIGVAVTAVIHEFIYVHYLHEGKIASLAEHFALQDGFMVSMFLVLTAVLPALQLPKKVKARPLPAAV